MLLLPHQNPLLIKVLILWTLYSVSTSHYAKCIQMNSAQNCQSYYPFGAISPENYGKSDLFRTYLIDTQFTHSSWVVECLLLMCLFRDDETVWLPLAVIGYSTFLKLEMV